MKNKLFILSSISFLLILMLSSCSNFSDIKQNNKNIILQGTVELPETINYSESTIDSRSATVNLTDTTQYTLKVTATCNNPDYSFSEPITLTASKKFAVALPFYGTWTLKVSAENSSGVEVLSDTCSPINVSENNTTISENFVLSPVQTASGKGNVSLAMTITSSITRITTYCSNANWSGVTVSINSTAATMTGSDIKSGSYQVQINFYNSSGELLYSTFQLINIYDTLTTNKWEVNGSGSSSPVTNSNGTTTFQVTQTLINSFNSIDTFYVGGTGANDSNSGTWVKPLATVSKAVQKCKAGATSTIIVDSSSNITETSQITIASNKNITIKSSSTTKPTIKRDSSYTQKSIISVASGSTLTLDTITLDGNSTSDNTISKCGIDNSGTLTLNNSTIQNFYTTNIYGGGIYTGGSLTIQDNSIITNNAAKNGGGICVARGGGTLTFTSGTVASNTATTSGGGIYYDGNTTCTIGSAAIIGDASKTSTADSENASNKAQNGGGLYVNSGTVIYKGKINYNYASSNGGGVYIANGTTFNFPESTSCLNYNYAGTLGGGIYGTASSSKSNITIQNGYIKNNKTGTSGSRGGGIYLAFCEATIQGGIIQNNQSLEGGGIFISNSGSLNVSGGTIGGTDNPNTNIGADADKKGPNIFCQSSGTFKISSNSPTITGEIYLENNPITLTTTGINKALTIRTKNIPTSTTPVTVITGTNCDTSIANTSKASTISNSTNYNIATNGKVYENKTLTGTGYTTLPSNVQNLYAATAEDLQQLRTLVASYTGSKTHTIKLLEDVTLKNWTSGIGTSEKPFKETFDGNNKTITFESGCTTGLFGYTDSATIKNVKTAGTISSSSGAKIGSIAKEIKGGTVSNCTSNTAVSNTDSWGESIGGLFGEVTSKTTDRDVVISNCYNYGNVSGNRYGIGGIAGSSSSAVFVNCYNAGNISGPESVAGISGTSTGNTSVGSLFINCGNIGTIEQDGDNRYSGAAGISSGASAYNLAWTSTLVYCWNTGTIKSNVKDAYNFQNAGAIWGKAETQVMANFQKCYYVISSVSGISYKNDNDNIIKKNNISELLPLINSATYTGYTLIKWEEKTTNIISPKSN